jgi:ATP-dependent RNA helicase DeaD
MKNIYSELEYLSREELIKRFVSVEFNRFLAYYENAKDINGDTGKSSRNRSNDNFTRYFINLGKLDQLTPASLIGLVNTNLKKHDFAIGQIEILKSFSFFEIENSIEESTLIEALNNHEFNDKTINVEKTNKPKRRSESSGSRFKKSGGSFKSDSFSHRKGKSKDKGKSWGNDSRSSKGRRRKFRD